MFLQSQNRHSSAGERIIRSGRQVQYRVAAWLRESPLANPRVTPFVECPNCRRLLHFGTARCPDCFEEIRDSYAVASAAVVTMNTRACAMANTIKSMDPIALLVLTIVMFDSFALPFSVPFILLSGPTWPLLALVVWFYHFGRFPPGDDDCLRARRQMQFRLAGWLLFCGVLWTRYFFLLSTK